MNADHAAVLDRVRKLLALATSPNVHEAAAAAAAAQALVERHRLEGRLAAHAAVTGSLTDGREAPLDRARRLRRWKVALATGLADANGCLAYTAEDARTGETLLLVLGRGEALHLAEVRVVLPALHGAVGAVVWAGLRGVVARVLDDVAVLA